MKHGILILFVISSQLIMYGCVVYSSIKSMYPGTTFTLWTDEREHRAFSSVMTPELVDKVSYIITKVDGILLS